MNTTLCRIAIAAWLLTPVARGMGQTPVVDSDRGGGALAEPLAPGDAIQLAFSREPALGGDFAVDEDGTVVLPLLGARTVSQRSLAELKRTLEAEYAQQIRNQDVRITMLRRVRILGAVKNPGLYRVDPTMTVVDAVALAGGANEQGKVKSVRIFRDGHEVGSHLDLNARLLPQLRSGDQIVVPERSWFSRNGGYVVAAGISAVAIIIARSAP
jgi:polysaccharide biosynthesis/export protein